MLYVGKLTIVEVPDKLSDKLVGLSDVGKQLHLTRCKLVLTKLPVVEGKLGACLKRTDSTAGRHRRRLGERCVQMVQYAAGASCCIVADADNL